MVMVGDSVCSSYFAIRCVGVRNTVQFSFSLSNPLYKRIFTVGACRGSLINTDSQVKVNLPLQIQCRSIWGVDV